MWRAVTACLAILVGVAAALATGEAAADERILSFRSEITVRTDGWVDVHERIDAVAEGYQIKHGIYRDFPTDYRDGQGRRVRVAFDIAAVRRDGQPEPYHTERLANGVRIYIGRQDALIPQGRHDYEIEYRTSRQLGYFPQYDELYWNVTGNGWIFPIEQAEAVIHLPPGATVVQSAAYTGRMGEQGTAFEVTRPGPEQIVFRTTRPLLPSEGLTVAVAWPKGVVAPPGTLERAGWFLSDHAGTVAPAAAALVALLYYLVAWWLVGRDPPRGVIIPQFEPPPDISPPAARYVRRMSFDNAAMAAGIVGLAVKGHLKIIDEPHSDVYRLDRLSDGTGKLLPIEAELLKQLFPADGTLILGSTELSPREQDDMRKRIVEARLSLAAGLERAYSGRSFAANYGYLFVGVILSVALWLGARQIVLDADPSSNAGRVISAIVMIAMAFVFARLLKAPSSDGRRLLDKIEGFKLYLGFAEKERMAILHPPDMTPEVYERYLPYALALDVENEWSEQFAAMLAKSGQRYEGYQPVWYGGRQWRSERGSMDFGRRIAVALPVAIAAAAMAPGSSSGGSGGGGSSGHGSSGGGGGGGGGGGW
jgi:uncharacterized membrane protein YgcG